MSRKDIIERAVASFRNADPTYGARVEAAVKELRSGAMADPADNAPEKTASF